MAKKKSTAQKIGGFVANEMLGVDDMRRVVKYVRQGDFKKAAKSAGAAAFEIGTSATAVGKAPALAVKAASKSVAKTASKEATKIGQKVGQKTAERLPAPKYPSAKGKKFNIKTEGKSTTTSKSGAKSTSPSSAKVSGTKKPPTENQRLGSFQGQTKTRTKTIVSTASEARSASKPVVQKALAKQTAKVGARGFIAGKAVKNDSNKKKK